MMKHSIQSNEKLTQLDSFAYLHDLLPELISFVLVSVFLNPQLKSEFPKLFCVCKRWTQILDCPNVHKIIGKIYTNIFFYHSSLERGQRRQMVSKSCGEQFTVI